MHLELNITFENWKWQIKSKNLDEMQRQCSWTCECTGHDLKWLWNDTMDEVMMQYGLCLV